MSDIKSAGDHIAALDQVFRDTSPQMLDAFLRTDLRDRLRVRDVREPSDFVLILTCRHGHKIHSNEPCPYCKECTDA